MAATLTETWNQHAFPDEYPAKEQIWAEESEQRRNEDRRDIYLELSDSGLKINRFTNKERKDAAKAAANGRALDSMLLAVGSPSYQEAYNNQLNFTINGEDFEITQGELFERAQKRAEDLRQQIDAARRRGASAEELALLTDELGRTEFVEQTANPIYGKMTEEENQAVQELLQQTPALTRTTNQEAGFGRDDNNTRTQKADMSQSMDHDAFAVREDIAGQWRSSDERTSFAIATDETPAFATSVSVAADFAAAASIDSAPNVPARDESAPDTPEQNTGFKLG